MWRELGIYVTQPIGIYITQPISQCGMQASTNLYNYYSLIVPNEKLLISAATNLLIIYSKSKDSLKTVKIAIRKPLQDSSKWRLIYLTKVVKCKKWIFRTYLMF